MDGNVSPGATRTLPPLAAVADTKAADHANVPSAHTVAQAGRRLEKGQGRIEVEVADRRQGRCQTCSFVLILQFRSFDLTLSNQNLLIQYLFIIPCSLLN